MPTTNSMAVRTSVTWGKRRDARTGFIDHLRQCEPGILHVRSADRQPRSGRPVFKPLLISTSSPTRLTELNAAREDPLPGCVVDIDQRKAAKIVEPRRRQEPQARRSSRNRKHATR